MVGVLTQGTIGLNMHAISMGMLGARVCWVLCGVGCCVVSRTGLACLGGDICSLLLSCGR